MNTLELNNISIKYVKDNVIDNFSLKLNKGNNLTVLGGTGSGKTAIAQVLSGKLKYEGIYKINGVELVKSNNYLINRFVAVILTDDIITNRKVVDLLFDALDGKEYDSDVEEKLVNKMITYFNLTSLLDWRLNNLTYDLRYFLLIIASFLKGIDYLVLDDVICHLKKDEKVLVYKYAKENKISIINLTTEIEEALYGDYLICLYNQKIAMEGKTLACLKEEKLLHRLGFKLPFMIDLSIQLNYYEVVKGLFLDKDELVKQIWN